ncbi:MAG: DUF503 domain-containing protein [candidate division WOR-3 bacterium]|nr:DUF503 domain-containing protein [candidate division WOR-3 bacterium]
MSIGLLVIDCMLNNSHSLKEKRSVFQSITNKIRQNFNVSVAETNYQDLWQRAELSIVFVNTDWKMIERNFQRILEFIEQDRRITILNHEAKSIY